MLRESQFGEYSKNLEYVTVEQHDDTDETSVLKS